MIYSRAVEYAIRALTNLAGQPPGTQRMARQIAEQENIPSFFLAKTLQQLARKKLLRSVKGPTGGFAFDRPSHKISLMDVIVALDGDGPLNRCMIGLPGCNRRSPCALDRSFSPVRRRIVRYLNQTTIASLAAQSGKKKRPSARNSQALAARAGKASR